MLYMCVCVCVLVCMYLWRTVCSTIGYVKKVTLCLPQLLMLDGEPVRMKHSIHRLSREMKKEQKQKDELLHKLVTWSSKKRGAYVCVCYVCAFVVKLLSVHCSLFIDCGGVRVQDSNLCYLLCTTLTSTYL